MICFNCDFVLKQLRLVVLHEGNLYKHVLFLHSMFRNNSPFFAAEGGEAFVKLKTISAKLFQLVVDSVTRCEALIWILALSKRFTECVSRPYSRPLHRQSALFFKCLLSFLH